MTNIAMQPFEKSHIEETPTVGTVWIELPLHSGIVDEVTDLLKWLDERNIHKTLSFMDDDRFFYKYVNGVYLAPEDALAFKIRFGEYCL